MARRKAKARKPLDSENTTVQQDQGFFLDSSGSPSSTMTREIEAVTTAELIASMRTGSSPPSRPQHGDLALDDLAQTIEAPTVPRLLILDAAEMLIAHVGFASVTETEIAKAANVGDDVFHAHFSDKAALLKALCERFCEHAIAVTDDATRSGIWDNATPGDVIEVAVRSIIDAVAARSALVHAVLTAGDPAMIEDFRRVGANMTAKVTQVVHAMRGRNKPSDRDIAFVLLLAVSLAHNVILVGTDWTGMQLDADDVYQQVIQAVRAHLDAPRVS